MKYFIWFLWSFGVISMLAGVGSAIYLQNIANLNIAEFFNLFTINNDPGSRLVAFYIVTIGAQMLGGLAMIYMAFVAKRRTMART